MLPPGPYGPAQTQRQAPVALPLHPSMPAAPVPLRAPSREAPLNAGVRTPPLPMPVWQPVPSGRTDVSVSPVSPIATPAAAAKQSPTLTVLIRDFEMTANLPSDWVSDLSCCASLAEHILMVVSELAQGLRILVSLEPSGPSVPVPRTGREDPAWHQVYGNYQELLAEALQLSNADSVRGFFQQSSCAIPGKITWRLGEVQGFLRLCFTAFGLPAPNCHPAVWYQLIREVTDDAAGTINEDQSLQLLRLVLWRLSGSQAEKEVQPAQGSRLGVVGSAEGLAASVANMSSKAPSPEPSTRTPGSAAHEAAGPHMDGLEVSAMAQLRQYGIKSPYRIAWNESAPELRGSARWSGSFGPRAETGPGSKEMLAMAAMDPASQLPTSAANQREVPEAAPCPAEAAEVFTSGRCMVEVEQPDAHWANISFGALAENAEMITGAASATGAGREGEDGLSGSTGLSTGLGKTSEASKLPEEKEVCQLLEAVQTAFLDLAQRLGSQRAIWKGQQVPLGDMQWFDLKAPVDPQQVALQAASMVEEHYRAQGDHLNGLANELAEK